MRVLAAMSGGVDSAVSALLMKEAGHTVIGVTMHLCGEPSPDAAAVAKKLGIPFETVDLRSEFSRLVIDPFISAYEAGRTPNPCVDCNRAIKFGALFSVADRLSCDAIATGHYARITREGDAYCLRKAADESKDQSYMLSCLTQETLPRVLLPLGELSKADVRALAAAHGFSNADKKDSQDICFIPDGDHAAFLAKMRGDYPAGDFLAADGTKLGRHKGLIRYTVGQRKGLGLSLPAPLFVEKLDAAQNAVILNNEAALMKSSVTLSRVNVVSAHFPSDGVCTARVRYRQKEVPAKAEFPADGRMKLDFFSPVRAPAPGQTAVLYQGDEVLAAGEIE